MDSGTCSICGNTERSGFHLRDGFICSECVRECGCYQLRRIQKKGTKKRKYIQLSPQKIWAERTARDVLVYKENHKLLSNIISGTFENQMPSPNGKMKVNWERKTFWVEEQDGTQEFFWLQMIKGFSLDNYYEKTDGILPFRKKRIDIVIELEGTDAEYLRVSLEQPGLHMKRGIFADLRIEQGTYFLWYLEKLTGMKHLERSETWQENGTE